MSFFSELFNRGKRELNKELTKQKPKLITAVKAEIARAKADGGAKAADAVKYTLANAVRSSGIFGMASVLVSSLIETIDTSRYEHLGDAGLDKLEAEAIKRINGARL